MLTQAALAQRVLVLLLMAKNLLKEIIPKSYTQIPPKKDETIKAKAILYVVITVGGDHNRNARINFGFPKEVVDQKNVVNALSLYQYQVR